MEPTADAVTEQATEVASTGRSTGVVLARSWLAWMLCGLAVIIAQVCMWIGWNRSGNWITVTGMTAVWSYTLYGVVGAAPIVVALLVCRSQVSLAVLLATMVGCGLLIGRYFRATDSSTAAIAWFVPLFYGVPFVGIVYAIERVVGRVTHIHPP